MPHLTGGQAVVRQLEREGVDIVFGIPGVHTLPVYDALIDSDVRSVVTRHEQGAGFMADGYARATGRVGVLLVITGPGLTNAATAIGQAYSDSSPLVVLSSHHATEEADRGKGLLHELRDQRRVMEGLVKHTHRVDRPEAVPEAIASAFDRAVTARPRPVHVDLPLDVLEGTAELELAAQPAQRTRGPSPPDPERLEAAAARFRTAETPVIVAGGGAQGAAGALEEFVDRFGVPVLTTVNGKGALRADHESHHGPTGRAQAEDLTARSDLLIAAGTELSPRDVGDLDLPDELIHIDVDPETIGRNHPATIGVVADVGDALRGLADRLGHTRADTGARSVSTGLEPPGPLWPTGDRDDRHRVLATLRDTLEDDAVVLNDMTKLCYLATRAFPAYTPRSFHFPRGFGTLGFAPPTAYGAAIGLATAGGSESEAERAAEGSTVATDGTGDRQVLALVGDGGFLFTVQDLATAVKYDLAVPVVVLNDESYDVVRDVQLRDYGRSTGTDIENPDVVRLAESFGAAAERVGLDEVEAELPEALERGFNRDRPTVIEVPVGF